MAYSNVIGTCKVLECKKLTSAKNPDWVGYSHKIISNLSPAPVWALSADGSDIPIGTECKLVVAINNFNSLRGVVVLPPVNEEF